ncbi:hypothetical protein BBJ28_00009659 [Nothophytophthora sp. Chile5]|nr:hypothetical protein BBJ28_00009659 [Nothophytophthora sp. Chile5]
MAAAADADRAEQLKLRGNQCFQKGKFRAAIDMYTEAIVRRLSGCCRPRFGCTRAVCRRLGLTCCCFGGQVLAPGQSVYYSNRALCYSKLEHWPNCRYDCEQALKHDALNTKASYLLGTSHMNLLAFDEAVLALQTALSSAEKTKKSRSFQDDIVAELRRVKKRQWHHRQQQRIARHEKVKLQLNQLFGARQTAELFEAQARQADAPMNGRMQRSGAEEVDALMAYVEHMSATFEKDMYPGEVPDYFICPVSMEIMHDPVVTPNGVSYERRCLEEHLRHNGPVDPLTRKRLTPDMLRPNASLRSAIQDYLEKNSWAFEY